MVNQNNEKPQRTSHQDQSKPGQQTGNNKASTANRMAARILAPCRRITTNPTLTYPPLRSPPQSTGAIGGHEAIVQIPH